MTGTYSNKKISIPGNQMFIVYETISTEPKRGFQASIHENGIYLVFGLDKKIYTASPRLAGIRLSGSSQYRDFFNCHY